MKRQGKVGFTWDSDAEEWAAWEASCIDKRQMEWQKSREQWARDIRPGVPAWSDFTNAYAYIARHSPTQRDLTPQPYSYPTRRKTPSYGAVIGVCGLVLMAVAFWIWG